MSKSTLSRWVNGQHVDDSLVLQGKKVSAEAKRSLAEHTGELAGKLLHDIEALLAEGAYSSYEKMMLFGIVSDKHALFKKTSQMDEALHVQVVWPDIRPMTPEEVESERTRVKAEYDAKQEQIE